MINSSKWNGNSEVEISLNDIIQFIKDSWKQLLFAGFIGAVVGCGYSFFLSAYKSTIVTKSSVGIDLLTWQSLQKTLPNLAFEIASKRDLTPEQKKIYEIMSNPQWWAKNVIPNFKFTKPEKKDLVTNNEKLIIATTTITSFDINIGGPNKENLIKDLYSAAQFLKSGATYLEINSLLSNYGNEIINRSAKIQAILTQEKINQQYHQERIKNLESLQKRFSSSTSFRQSKNEDLETKQMYLSVENLLVAAHIDLSKSNEEMSRLNDELVQLKVMNKFLDQAIPAIKNQNDGFSNIQTLLGIEKNLRADIALRDLTAQLVLDQIRVGLLNIETSFASFTTEGSSLVIDSTTNNLKVIAVGLVIAEFLMLMYLLVHRLIVRPMQNI